MSSIGVPYINTVVSDGEEVVDVFCHFAGLGVAEPHQILDVQSGPMQRCLHLTGTTKGAE